MHHPEMLTQSSQLVEGLTLWHVYGHVANSRPTPITIKGGMFRPKSAVSKSLFFRTKELPWAERSCHDCGLDGVNYNHNRLFFTEEAAEKFIEHCVRTGVRPKER